jgi:uncharacterized protein YlxP (DUF503 family)
MVIGAARVELHVHGSQSLKQKRGVVREGTWQCVVLGICTVSGDGQSARRRLEKAIDFIEDLHLAEVTDQEVEIL